MADPTAQACTEPECTGTVMDGYCDTCGMAPRPAADPAASGPASPGPASGRPAGTGPAVAGTAGAGRAPTGTGGGAAGASGAPGPVHSPSARTVESVDPGHPVVPPADPFAADGSTSSASARLASAPLGSARTGAGGTRVTRRVGSGVTRLRRAGLGAGITQVPALPVTDPEQALIDDPQVPEERRFCPSCNHAVGRSRDGLPGRTDGFCAHCRAPFSFAPKLRPGDLVSGQYQVAGCIAHGGMGWIYLARDLNVDRWVVLKGLLNSGDTEAYAAAMREREYLARLAHPLVVEIFNFVQHDGAGYIVMEYVGGVSLKDILKQRMTANRGVYDPLPPDQAVAYVLEILPAFQYLHDLGLLYCDFKPDNMIQVGDAVKLIDLGGVVEAANLPASIFGTVGYQAPEVARVGPSVASDIFTVGRTLGVFAMEFRGYQSTYVASWPPVRDVPLFRTYDSLYRLLLKACAPDPSDRFASADEMRVQLVWVLREIVATQQGTATAEHSSESLLFNPPRAVADIVQWADLPVLRPDHTDPMAAWLGALSVTEPRARLAQLDQAPEPTTEVRLAKARIGVELGLPDLVAAQVNAILAEDPWEWRAEWVRGLSHLAQGDHEGARASFNAVYGEVPGEPAAKLALALACEVSGEPDVAENLYRVCARCDAAYVAAAAFGLARIAVGASRPAAALAALDLVPATSRAYIEARRRRAEVLSAEGATLTSLAEALDVLAGITVEPMDRARFEAQVLRSALAKVLDAGGGGDAGVTLMGRPATVRNVRNHLEAALRHLARLCGDEAERVALVDEANSVRAWTRR